MKRKGEKIGEREKSFCGDEKGWGEKYKRRRIRKGEMREEKKEEKYFNA